MERLKALLSRRRWRWLLGGILILGGAAIAVAWFLDESLRRTMEAELNRRLEGYSVRIGRLDFHPIGFSLDLEQVTLIQDANPEPPVATIPRLSASVQWSEIIFGRLVANFSVEDPTLYINQAHFRKELADEVPIERRGWQEALQAIYPLKVNEFKVTGATLTYVDDTQFPPLHLSHIVVRARNIRNIRSPERTYPSSLEAKAVVFGTGRVALVGHADFLATPHLGVKADLTLESIALPYFRPILRRYGVRLRGGSLSAGGQVEYAPWIRLVDLTEATVKGVQADYLDRGDDRGRARTSTRANASARANASTRTKASTRTPDSTGDSPATVVKVGRFQLVDSEIGYVNERKSPTYRVFLSEATLRVRDLANPPGKGTAEATLTGRFMGSGATTVKARFRPAAPKANLQADIAIENTDLQALNDLLRAHGKFDVAGGVISVYAEVAVQDDMMRGYVKPLFRDVVVYHAGQDRHKPALKKLYERLVGGASKLLENRPRDEVATRVDISGRLEQPDTGTLTAALRLIQNAFFRAILPGFEHEVQRNVRS